MRIIGKLIGLVLALLILAAAVGLFFRNTLIKSAAAKSIREMTGFDLELQKVDVGLLNTAFEIDGLKLFNPPDFPRREAFDINQVMVDYDLPSLITGGEMHFSQVVVDIANVAVVTKPDGETNMERLEKASGGGKKERPRETPGPGAGKPEKKPKAGKAETPIKWRIDELTVRLGTLSMYDYSGGGAEPEVFEHPMGVNFTEHDITDPNQLMGPILMQVGLGMAMNADYLASQARKNLGKYSGQAEEVTKELDKALGTDLSKQLGKLLGGKKPKSTNATSSAAGQSSAAAPSGEDTQTEDLQKAVGGLLKALGNQ